jgi:hypothetical protein
MAMGSRAKFLVSTVCLGTDLMPALYTVVGQLLNADFNVTTDQVIPLWVYRPSIIGIYVTNSNGAPLTTAQGGIYSAASKGGTAIVAATQGYTQLNGNPVYLQLTLAAFLRITTNQIFFSLTTAQGAAAHADIYVVGLATDQ